MASDFPIIMDAGWFQPIWKPVRPFVLSRLEVSLSEGVSPITGDPFTGTQPAPVTVQLIIIEPPGPPTGGAYAIAQATLTPETENAQRIVVDVEGPFGPRTIPAGWWVLTVHDSKWFEPDAGNESATFSVTPHGTFI